MKIIKDLKARHIEIPKNITVDQVKTILKGINFQISPLTKTHYLIILESVPTKKQQTLLNILKSQ